MRKVILHYHLFKNAGTSIDEMLKASFGERWVTREFPAGHAVNQIQVAEWIRDQPEAVAFSSHTALFPYPHKKALEVFPIIFVRHPIDRIASAYTFERKQGGDGFGAVLARSTTLAGYIDVRLSMGYDRQCRNFHCARLAQMFKPDTGSERERALRAVEALPVVGLVEAFDASVMSLSRWLKPHFPQLQALVVQRNASRDSSVPLETRLADVRRDIGDETFERVLAANADDMEVFQAVSARFDR